VIVMYSGLILEEADVYNLYENPCHPYTTALLGALPRVDYTRHQRLDSIPGAPPNLLIEPKHCPFAPRCQFVMDICREQMPQLELIGSDHQIACWVDIHTGKSR